MGKNLQKTNRKQAVVTGRTWSVLSSLICVSIPSANLLVSFSFLFVTCISKYVCLNHSQSVASKFTRFYAKVLTLFVNFKDSIQLKNTDDF